MTKAAVVKASVSIPAEDWAFLDKVANDRFGGNKSKTLAYGLKLLRSKEARKRKYARSGK